MQIPFLSRIPVGTYHIRFTNPNEDDIIEENILVFVHLKDAYADFLTFLPELIENEKATEDGYNLEVVCNGVTEEYVPQLEGKLGFEPYFFEYFVRHFDYNNSVPRFIPFTDREKFDIDNIAQDLYERNVGTKSVNAELDAIWDNFEEEICAFFHHNSTIFKSETYTALKNISLKDEISNSTIHTPPTISYETSIIRKRIEQAKTQRAIEDAAETVMIEEVSEEVESTTKGVKQVEYETDEAVFEIEKDDVFSEEEKKNLLTIPEVSPTKKIVHAYYETTDNNWYIFAKKGQPIARLFFEYQNGDYEEVSVKAPSKGLYVFFNKDQNLERGEYYGTLITKRMSKLSGLKTVIGAYYQKIFFAHFDSKMMNVIFDGEVYSASGAAKAACLDVNQEIKSVNGMTFWKYIDWETETLIPIKELKK